MCNETPPSIFLVAVTIQTRSSTHLSPLVEMDPCSKLDRFAGVICDSIPEKAFCYKILTINYADIMYCIINPQKLPVLLKRQNRFLQTIINEEKTLSQESIFLYFMLANPSLLLVNVKNTVYTPDECISDWRDLSADTTLSAWQSLKIFLFRLLFTPKEKMKMNGV